MPSACPQITPAPFVLLTIAVNLRARCRPPRDIIRAQEIFPLRIHASKYFVGPKGSSRGGRNREGGAVRMSAPAVGGSTAAMAASAAVRFLASWR